MPLYVFTHNAGTSRERKSRHELANDDAALHSARCRTGAIDPSVSVDLLPGTGPKRLATRTARDGVLELSGPK